MVRVEYHRKSVLLTGDAEDSTMGQALKDLDSSGGPFPPTTIFLVAHHGAETHESNEAKWFDGLKPAISIFSVGINGYGHPKESVFSEASRYSLWSGGELRHDISLGIYSEAVSRPPTKTTTDSIYSTFDQGNISLTWGAGPPITGDVEKAPFSDKKLRFEPLVSPGDGGGTAEGTVIYVPKPAVGGGAASAPGGGGGAASSASSA